MLYAPGGVRDEDEVDLGVLLRDDDAIGDRTRHRALERVPRQQSDGAHRRGRAECLLGGAAQLHGAGGPPRRRLHGAQASGQRQAPAVGVPGCAPRRRRHVAHGQMGLNLN